MTTDQTTISFRYVWPIRVSIRKLSTTEAIVLNVSPKFATCHDHVSFQWSLKLHGNANLHMVNEDDMDDEDVDYIALSLYYNDGPSSSVSLRAMVGILEGEKKSEEDKAVIEKNTKIRLHRGRECELIDGDGAKVSNYVRENVIRLSVLLRFDRRIFDPISYLNAVTPTPAQSFLTANYRARASSKKWKKKSIKRMIKNKTEKTTEDSSSIVKSLDYYESRFDKVLERERLRMEEEEENMDNRSSSAIVPGGRETFRINNRIFCRFRRTSHLFKAILISCCDSCQRRASLSPEEMLMEKEKESAAEDETDGEHDEEDAFECSETGKEEVHDMLANMFFNKVALSEMDYVEDFADFLIDAELNDLPVLKRACERYLCGELNMKSDLLTSLLLDMLFLSLVFNLPVMKSMTLAELAERNRDLEDVDQLLMNDEYQQLDRRVKSMSDRSLAQLVDECKRFREQKMRVQRVQ